MLKSIENMDFVDFNQETKDFLHFLMYIGSKGCNKDTFKC